jgi:predicted Zn finger-like uncharacterized protein
MKLTCEKCHTTYNVDPAKIGTGAHKMRCAKCQHVWVHRPEGMDDIIPQVVSTMPHVMPRADDDHHHADGHHVIPASVRPYTQAPMPPVDVHVLGLPARQFGYFSFLFLTFLTLIILFLFRTPVTHSFPVMSGLYQVIGLHVPVLGEGLQFSEVRAQRKGKKLEVSAKLTNISSGEMTYPAVQVDLLGVYGAVLQKWVLEPQDAVLQAGGSIPVNLSFDETPEEGRTIEIKVAAD